MSVRPIGGITQRRITPEHMDDPDATASQIDQSLRFIRMVNLRLGGTAAALGCLKQWSKRWPRDHVIRLLDVGTGSADIPLAICRWAQAAGFQVHVTAIDRHPVTLDLARQHVENHPSITFVQADALRLLDRFKAGSFHYAHAGMFLHHLPDVEVMTVLSIMSRLSSHGMIWNDLIRSRFAKLAVRALSLGAPRLVRHDALVSVEAGFTEREAMELAGRVGLPQARLRKHLAHRFALTSEHVDGWPTR